MTPKAKKWIALTALAAALVSIDATGWMLLAPRVRAAATGSGKAAAMARASGHALATALSTSAADLSHAVMGSAARALFHGTRRSTDAYAFVVRATPALEGRKVTMCREHVSISSGANGCVARSFVIGCPEGHGPRKILHLEKMVDGPMLMPETGERAGAGPPSQRTPENGFARMIPQVMIY